MFRLGFHIPKTRWFMIAENLKRTRARAWPALVVVAAVAAGTWAITVSPRPESRLWLEGDSTLHSYQSSATEFAVAFDMSGAKPFDEAIRTGTMKAVQVQVPVKALKSGKGGLDKRLWKALA